MGTGGGGVDVGETQDAFEMFQKNSPKQMTKRKKKKQLLPVFRGGPVAALFAATGSTVTRPSPNTSPSSTPTTGRPPWASSPTASADPAVLPIHAGPLAGEAPLVPG